MTKQRHYCCLLLPQGVLLPYRLVRRLTVANPVAPGSNTTLSRRLGSSVLITLSKLLSVPPEHEPVVRLKKVAIQLTAQGLQKYSAVGVKPYSARSVCQSFKSSQSTLRFLRYPTLVDLRLARLGPPRLPAPCRGPLISTVATNQCPKVVQFAAASRLVSPPLFR